MAENFLRSKLKRKKPSVEELHPESLSTGKSGRSALFHSDSTAESSGSVLSEAAWWNREQLPDVENLWALSLKSALPHRVKQRWGLVPDLPHPSPVRCTALNSDEKQWCDLSGEVAPLPEPAPSSLRTSSDLDPLRCSSSQQDLGGPTEAVPASPDRQLSSRSRHDGKTTSTTDPLTNGPELPLLSWKDAAVPARCSDVGGEGGRTGEEQVEPETGPDNTQLLTNKMEVSDSQVFLQMEYENGDNVVENKVKEEVMGSVRRDGAAGAVALQSCPMCLLVFPVGFTQMDCDGHLAQCLSEMNVDMTW
ncbi:uncharacterized protein si:ch73-70k4.1 [Mastacembelus armatus]|uniref:uncharacterized protein si:ch73-70k4.1 n=1 Tax=Mastacembelus armatus TaxID=205130 RepID=UPI000E46452C|nr:Fanconi anemia core complex-associated protein 20 [Mastacembelus armatus]